MSVLGITSGDTLSLTEIREIEAKSQIKLPESYVTFLTEIQNDSQSYQLHEKAPYYGFYSLEKALEMNEEWQITLHEPFRYTNDFEFDDIIDFQEDTSSDNIEKRMETDIDFANLINKYSDTSNLNGTIPICEYGCGDFFRLVVNGEKKGEIWADCGCINLTGYYSLNVDVITFYENWLDRQIHLKSYPQDKMKYLQAYYPILEFGNNPKYKLEKID
ncbi:SMI1/KNR4 family protein [Capnocytophaga stomatis]|nr:SMI1/KNR4 family protein [Capnocytophaga stomatis]